MLLHHSDEGLKLMAEAMKESGLMHLHVARQVDLVHIILLQSGHCRTVRILASADNSLLVHGLCT